MTAELTWWPVAQGCYFAAGGFWAMLMSPLLNGRARGLLGDFNVLVAFLLVFGVMWTWPVVYWTAAAQLRDDSEDGGGWDGRS